MYKDNLEQRLDIIDKKIKELNATANIPPTDTSRWSDVKKKKNPDEYREKWLKKSIRMSANENSNANYLYKDCISFLEKLEKVIDKGADSKVAKKNKKDLYLILDRIYRKLKASK